MRWCQHLALQTRVRKTHHQSWLRFTLNYKFEDWEMGHITSNRFHSASEVINQSPHPNFFVILHLRFHHLLKEHHLLQISTSHEVVSDYCYRMLLHYSLSLCNEFHRSSYWWTAFGKVGQLQWCFDEQRLHFRYWSLPYHADFFISLNLPFGINPCVPRGTIGFW